MHPCHCAELRHADALLRVERLHHLAVAQVNGNVVEVRRRTPHQQVTAPRLRDGNVDWSCSVLLGCGAGEVLSRRGERRLHQP